MASEKFTNAASTTLNGALNNSTTSVVVMSATGFPTAGNFRILVDSELMLVTSVSGSTFTVTRGAESTSAVSHLNGATVTEVLTSGALDARLSDGCQEDVQANQPAAEKAGRLFLVDDDVIIQRDTGAAWNNWGPLFHLTPPPSSGNWTAVNSPNALTDTKSGLFLLGKSDAGVNIRGYQVNVPAAPYKIDWCMLINCPMVSYHQTGFFWSDGTKLHTISFLADTDTISTTYAPFMFLDNSKYTNVTTASATYNWAHGNARLGILPLMLGPLVFVRCEDDNTSRKVSLSVDNQNWQQVFTVSRTDFLTPTKVGFFQNANTDSTFTSGLNLIHWLQH